MNPEELAKKIGIVLAKEDNDKKNANTFYLDEETGTFVYENAQTLTDLFYSLPETDDSHLSDVFLKIIDFNKNIRTLPLRFWVMIKLGRKDLALEHIEHYKYHSINSSKSTIIELVDIIVSNNLLALTPEELYDLREVLELIRLSENPYVCQQRQILSNKLIDLSVEGLKNEIKSTNIEINQDKEEVKRIIKFFDFDDKYNEFLTEIDEHLNTNSKSLTAGLINDFRNFFSDLIIDMAKKIASTENEEIPKYKSEEGKVLTPIGCARKYIKIKLELSDSDNDFIDSFIRILHKRGGHSFVANKSYFRLTRNIAIEIILLLLSKMTDKYKPSLDT